MSPGSTTCWSASAGPTSAWSICRSIWCTPASAAVDTSRTIPPDPVTIYGKTMSQAERLILARRPDACILRISLPMGISFNGHAGAIDWIQSRFKKSRPATLYYDEIRTPTYTDCLNRLFEAVLAGDLSGLYHAGGPRRLSLYQIAQIINRVGGYDPRAPDRLLAARGRPDPAAGRQRDDGFGQAQPRPGLSTRSTPGRWTTNTCRRIATGTASGRRGERGSPELLAEVLYRNPRTKAVSSRRSGT